MGRTENACSLYELFWKIAAPVDKSPMRSENKQLVYTEKQIFLYRAKEAGITKHGNAFAFPCSIYGRKNSSQ